MEVLGQLFWFDYIDVSACFFVDVGEGFEVGFFSSFDGDDGDCDSFAFCVQSDLLVELLDLAFSFMVVLLVF